MHFIACISQVCAENCPSISYSGIYQGLHCQATTNSVSDLVEGNVGTETIQALIDRFSPSVKSSNPQRIKAKCFPNIYPPLGERSDRWKPPKILSREIAGDEVDHMKVILHVIPVGDGNHCFEVEHRFNPLKTFPLTIAYLRQVFFCFVFKSQ